VLTEHHIDIAHAQIAVENQNLMPHLAELKRQVANQRGFADAAFPGSKADGARGIGVFRRKTQMLTHRESSLLAILVSLNKKSTTLSGVANSKSSGMREPRLKE